MTNDKTLYTQPVSTADETPIRVVDLHKAFGSNKVLKGIDLEVANGEVIAVIGPSGSGKSTLLRCLNRLEDVTSGEVFITGENIAAAKGEKLDKVRQRIGMVFQHFNLFPNMTVLQNVALAPTELKKMSKADARKRAEELLARVGLADKADARPSQLSGGQKQRVAIARALAMSPQIMLFDSPKEARTQDFLSKVL
jgi:polar amino acid transport system ATP-binding protein